MPVLEGTARSSGRQSMGVRRVRAVFDGDELVGGGRRGCFAEGLVVGAVLERRRRALPVLAESRLVVTGTARLASSTWTTGCE